MNHCSAERSYFAILMIAFSFDLTTTSGEEPLVKDSPKIVEDRTAGKLVGRYAVATDATGVEVRHGPFETFFPNGKTEEKGNYHWGDLDAAYERRSSDGRILEAGKYDRGARTGLWKFSLATGAIDPRRSGTYTIEEEKDTVGRVIARGSVFKSKKIETWTVFYPDGRVAAKMEIGPEGVCGRARIWLWSGVADESLLDFESPTTKSKTPITIDWAAVPEFAPRTSTDPSEWSKLRDAVKALGATDGASSRRGEYARRHIDLALLDGVNKLLQVMRSAPSGQEELAQRIQRERLSPVAHGLEYEFAPARSPFAKMTSEYAFLKWYALCALAQFGEFRDELTLMLALAGVPRSDISPYKPDRGIADSIEVVLSKGWSHVQEGWFARAAPKDPVPSEAIARAVDWLLRHQSEDGRFPACDFIEQCAINRCSGQGVEYYDLICTAVSIQAILGDPRNASSIPAERALALLNGVHWLLAQQNEAGCFGSYSRDRSSVYVDLAVHGTSLATSALAESAVFFRSASIRAAAERGVRGLLLGLNPYKAWGNMIPGDNANFMDSTGYAVEAIHVARAAGIAFSEELSRDVLNWINGMTDELNWRAGYRVKGEFTPRAPGLDERWSSTKSEWLTAVAMNSRVLLGERLDSSPALRGGIDLLRKRPPSWDEAEGTIDPLYWLAGTRAMRGFRGKEWDLWRESVRKATLTSQRTDGDENGSWDPQYDPWGHRGGRVHTTAVLALTLAATVWPNNLGESPKKH